MQKAQSKILKTFTEALWCLNEHVQSDLNIKSVREEKLKKSATLGPNHFARKLSRVCDRFHLCRKTKYAKSM